MDHKIEPIESRRIYLDNENPRHDPIDNEPEIIKYLLGNELVPNLAKDIASKGLSPIEIMAVIRHPVVKGSYVSVEGNRRLCAIKLLQDPDKAPDEKRRKVYRNLKGKMQSLPATLQVVVFDSRAAARPWIELRHSGALDGVATRAWNARQKTRFNQGGSNTKPSPNVLASQLLDYAHPRGLITKQEMDGISLTTLTRYLSNPLLRDAIGLLNPRSLEVQIDQAAFDTGVQKFLKDAHANKAHGVHSRSNKQERQDYARQLRALVGTTHRVSDPYVPEPKPGSTASGRPSGGSTKPRHSRNPDARTRVIPFDFVVPIKDKILKRVFDELREIEPNQFSFAAAYLVRAFIEHAMKVYADDHSVATHGDLHQLITRVADHLQANGVKDNDVKNLRVMASDKHNRISPHTLGNFVHGGTIPSRVELNRRWDTLEKCLGIVLERLK